jgi:hypothetical protein
MRIGLDKMNDDLSHFLDNISNPALRSGIADQFVRNIPTIKDLRAAFEQGKTPAISKGASLHFQMTTIVSEWPFSNGIRD